jgi:multiple sugar transport system permease protein
MVSAQKLTTHLFGIVARTVLYLIVIAGAIAYSLPLLWMIRTSIMPPWQVNLRPIQWIPAELHWETWQNMWQKAPFGRFFVNTVAFSLLSVLGTVVSSSLAAYAFARIRFRGRSLLFMMVLSTMMLPAQVTLIPNYLIFTKLGWVNTYLPLLVPIWLGSSAFNIFLLRQYMMTIPLEYDDAAEIDGCSTLGIFWRIILPLTTPALGAIAIMHFTWSWNNFMGPLIYLNDLYKFPISVGLQMFRTRLRIEIEELMAATLASVIPIVVMFFVAQRHFIRGIVISGIKG